jgi:hypothetical protein
MNMLSLSGEIFPDIFPDANTRTFIKETVILMHIKKNGTAHKIEGHHLGRLKLVIKASAKIFMIQI